MLKGVSASSATNNYTYVEEPDEPEPSEEPTPSTTDPGES